MSPPHPVMLTDNLLLDSYQPVLRTVLRYGSAIVAVALALLLTLLLWPFMQPLIVPLFFVAVIVSVLYNGIGPAMLATILSSLAIDYFFLEPVYSLFRGWDDISRMLLFGVEAGSISLLINGRKQTGRALRESEERFRLLIEGVQDYAIYMLDEKGCVVSWNEGAENIIGYRAEEIIGQHVSRFYAADDNREGKAERELYLAKTEGRCEEEGWRVRKDGTRFCANVIVTALRDQNGQLRGYAKVTRDITERKQAEEALRKSNEELEVRVEQRTLELSQANADLKEQIIERERSEQERARLLVLEREARREAEMANRAKDEFLATVSHELRTPLTPLLIYTRLLSTGKLDAHNFTRALTIIERNVKLQAQLIDDLLDVSRITTGKLRLDVRQVELVSVIEAAFDAVRLAAEVKNIRLNFSLEPQASTVAITGDPVRLQQIIWNLLANAIKFTPEGGAIEVKLERSEARARITVSDTGQGINPEFLPYVFDRFRQADSTSTRKHGGLGLGLSIVRHLTELHGGVVTAASQGDGRGATFTLEFPGAANLTAVEPPADGSENIPPADHGAPVENYPQRLDGLRVLVVDDEADTRDSISITLEMCGAQVTAVASAAAAFTALEQWQPDVLVSDIGMPDEDGYKLIHRVRSLNPAHGGGIPAVALTAYASAEEQRHALAAGYQMHVPKPVSPTVLTTVVATLSRQYGRVRPHRELSTL